LPDDLFIQQAELNRFLHGESAKLHDGKTGETVQVDPVDTAAFNYYAETWDLCRRYGWPYHGGWAEQPPWLVDFVRFFDRCYEQIESWRAEKQRRAIEAQRKR